MKFDDLIMFFGMISLVFSGGLITSLFLNDNLFTFFNFVFFTVCWLITIVLTILNE